MNRRQVRVAAAPRDPQASSLPSVPARDEAQPFRSVDLPQVLLRSPRLTCQQVAK